jgi:hypothetical protein
VVNANEWLLVVQDFLPTRLGSNADFDVLIVDLTSVSAGDFRINHVVSLLTVDIPY